MSPRRGSSVFKKSTETDLARVSSEEKQIDAQLSFTTNSAQKSLFLLTYRITLSFQAITHRTYFSEWPLITYQNSQDPCVTTRHVSLDLVRGKFREWITSSKPRIKIPTSMFLQIIYVIITIQVEKKKYLELSSNPFLPFCPSNLLIKQSRIISKPQFLILQSINFYKAHQMYHRKRKHIGHRSKYTKVPIKTKLKFLKKVILEGFSIKDSATIFNINYSTAKTLIGQYKSKTFVCNLSAFTEETDLDLDDCNRQRCGYREVLADYQERISHTVSGTPLFYLQNQAREDHEQLRLKMVSQYVPRIEIISSNSCK